MLYFPLQEGCGHPFEQIRICSKMHLLINLFILIYRFATDLF